MWRNLFCCSDNRKQRTRSERRQCDEDKEEPSDEYSDDNRHDGDDEGAVLLKNKLQDLKGNHNRRQETYIAVKTKIDKLLQDMRNNRLQMCLAMWCCGPCLFVAFMGATVTDTCCGTDIVYPKDKAHRQLLEYNRYLVLEHEASHGRADLEKLRYEYMQEETRRLSILYTKIRYGGGDTYSDIESKVLGALKEMDTKYRHVDERLLAHCKDCERSITKANAEWLKICRRHDRPGPQNQTPIALLPQDAYKIFVPQRIDRGQDHLVGSTYKL